jgi:spermidine synthase
MSAERLLPTAISTQILWLAAALYGLTGLTSVAYEVLWVRMLSLQFGVSIFAVVLTVSTFMLGLGAGSLLSARSAYRVRRPLLLLALLEGGIALYALLLPLLLQTASASIEAAAAQLSLFQWYGLIAAAAVGLLLLPACAMGAGFPLVVTALGGKSAPLARIYGINTLGAACGALLPLLLLPTMGLAGAVQAVAVLGLLAAVGLAWLASRTTPQGATGTNEPHHRPPFSALGLYAGIGAASLMLEIAWTRLFGVIMLRTEYVLALILAALLLGIGLGSLVAPRKHREGWYVVLPLSACAFALAGLWALPTLSAWLEHAQFSSLFSALATQGLALVLLTLPVTLVLGAWLPLLNQRFNGGGMWLYGANSVGAALGAVIAGLVLIPNLGSAGTIVVAAILLLGVGLAFAKSRAAWFALPVFVVVGWPLAALPPVKALQPKAQAGAADLYVYEDAVSMTHVVEQPDGQRLLLTDMQRMDASTDPTAVFVQSNQARLPLLLQGQPRSVLFLGLGTGISVSGSLPYPELQRTAVELSQGAIVAAGRWFAPANQGAAEQTRIERDDARHFLVATRAKYDVIIGDVFHPDIAGLSSLLSLQQFERARNRLSDDGLFVQWLAVNQFDVESLNVILRTFRQVFPDAQLFLDGMHLALVGPRGKFGGAVAVQANLARLTDGQRDAATAGEGNWTWLGRYWGPIPESAGRTQNEWAPVIEFRLPRARYAGNLDVAPMLNYLLQLRPSMRAAEALLGVPDGSRDGFERSYAATELMVRSWLAAMQGGLPQANRLMRLAYQANPQDRWVTYAVADAMLASVPQARQHGWSEQDALQEILRVSPQHVEALRALWRLQRDSGSAQAEATRAHLLALSPLDREARSAAN